MKIRRQLLVLATTVIFVLSAVAIWQQSAPKPQDHRLSELAAAQGQIVSYSLLDDSRGTHQYTFQLTGYNATFQIPAEFAAFFAKARFQSDLKKGDFLSLSIPSDSASKLISGGTIPVFAVRTKTADYLDEHDTLAAYNNKNKPTEQPPSLDWLLYSVIGVVSLILLTALGFGISKFARILAARPRKPKDLSDISDPGALDESAQRMKKWLTKAAPQPKSLPVGASDPRLLTAGDSKPELVSAVDSESNSSDSPQA